MIVENPSIGCLSIGFFACSLKGEIVHYLMLCVHMGQKYLKVVQ